MSGDEIQLPQASDQHNPQPETHTKLRMLMGNSANCLVSTYTAGQLTDSYANELEARAECNLDLPHGQPNDYANTMLGKLG